MNNYKDAHFTAKDCVLSLGKIGTSHAVIAKVILRANSIGENEATHLDIKEKNNTCEMVMYR